MKAKLLRTLKRTTMTMKQFLPVAFGVLMLVSKVMSECSSVDLNSDSELKASANLSVDCQADSIVVTIDLCSFKRMGYAEVDFSIVGDASVIGYEFSVCPDASLTSLVSGDVKTFTISGNFSECQTDISLTNPETIVYKNAIRNVGYSGSSTIARRKNALFEFSCNYKRFYNVSDALHVTPQVVAVEGSPFTAVGDFNPTVRLCEDAQCMIPISSGAEVDVLDTVYLVFQTAKDLHIQIIDIDATEKADPEMSTETFEFVGEGCKRDTEATLTNNGEMKSMVEFPFFHWTSDEDLEVYFHVVYKLCDPDADTCTDPCTEKRRRRAARTAFENENLISKTLGPFKTRVQ